MAVVSSIPEIPYRMVRYPDIGYTGIMRSRSGIVEEEVVRGAVPAIEIVEEVEEEDRFYVLVGKDVKESESLVMWALRNPKGNKICILHVHQPSHKIPISN